jgi:hypothetical protein
MLPITVFRATQDPTTQTIENDRFPTSHPAVTQPDRRDVLLRKIVMLCIVVPGMVVM